MPVGRPDIMFMMQTIDNLVVLAALLQVKIDDILVVDAAIQVRIRA